MSDEKLTLLPCPFCGGPADFEECQHGSSVEPKSCTWSVGCSNQQVDCIAYQMMASFDRKVDAAEAWNKRTLTSNNRRDICKAICKSRVFETGQGSCSLLCLDQLGDARRDCSHVEQIHGKLADQILIALK